MSTPFIGEIRMFAGNFAPADWHFCDGSILPISENDALFALIGTTYGGDGQTTFAIPDLRGRLPIHQGTLSGGGNYVLGQRAGSETVTLSTNQIPAHNHPMTAAATANTTVPTGNVFGGTSTGQELYTSATTPISAMASQTLNSAGGSQPHNNMMPYLCVSFIIALYGIFPSQN